MADQFQIVPYKVRSAGTDVPPEEVQAAVNSLALQTTIALNSVASDPTGPAGGDLGGTYPNPTVVKLHVTSGTESGVAITASTVDSTPVGANTPSTGAFTTATAGSVFASGGAVPGVGATGTQIYNSPNPTAQFIDSIRSANNKNAFVTWGSTVLAFGFANDAFTTFVNALTITGGQATGISGITSNSGSGSWVHTGGFSATSFTVTNAVTVANGGTGRQTLTAHGVLLGEGTAAINQTAVGTTGQMLLGVTGADPAFGNNPTITGGTITGLSSAIPVASGGTGAATFTAHGVLLGEGTGSIVATAVGTTGQALIGQTGADPIFGAPTGALINVQRFTASGTYTPTAGTNSVIIYATGGGGGGGGTGTTTAAQVAAGGAGTTGSWGVARITSPTSQTVTIGVAGAAGAAGANAGGAGGQTSVGTYVVAPGGGGGPAGTAAAFANATIMAAPGSQGAAPTSSGTLLYGSAGPVGSFAQWAYNGSGFLPAFGGSGPFGSGGFSSSNNSAGTAASGFGAGGSGAIAGASQGAFAGAAGTAGLVIAYEYA